MTTEVSTAKHKVIIDEVAQMGGKDSGANPLETLLASLAGCKNATANAVAREMEFDLKGITFTIEGEFDPRGFKGDSSVRTYFETVWIEANVSTSEPEERVKDLQRQVEQRCPVYNLLKAANVTLHDTWSKA
ncbi:OsmC family protein [Desertibacillus haloalkaliphilus]|uniref:OsmC family protein n=1 Tax=Desertibacillus haloalkaliphilus TaxID=1328930 RepID=UPI001C27C998|nr:OsmC family protein [Desertibacillus haloalkaliphilus]MBU8905332.1 OsmC family protein [Desertibacillus haloalkaliphilus]